MATHREQRRLVSIEAQCRANDAWQAATICNISSRGLMAKCAEPPQKGARVELRHQGIVIAGEVAWALGGRFGLRCPGPIDHTALLEASRDGNVGRRALPRVPVRVAAEFFLRDNAYTVLLTDMSQSGARIYMPIPPPTGIKGRLCWGDNERSCTVLWSNRDAFGVSFDDLLPNKSVVTAQASGNRHKSELGAPVWANPSIPAKLRSARPAERRQNRRTSLRLDCDIRQGEGPWLRTCLENVSLEGFRLAWFAGCQLNEGLSLRLPDGTLVEAEIQRRDDRMIACRFVTGLDRAVLDRVSVRQA